ncbi:hypothetical protein HQ560_20310 [bacterium]|nr:hypothetical protein [bacterium]
MPPKHAKRVLVGGGTNGRGHKISTAYQINKALQFAVTYFHTFQDLNSGGDDNYKRLQADFKLKF